MKKLTIFVLIIAAFVGIVVGKSLFAKGATQNVLPSKTVPTATTNTTPTTTVQQPGLPVRLRIPAINVNAAVEDVGMDSKGRMDIPKNDIDVAWYQLGYRPGSIGNAVMAGHLDRQTGAPAVFWDLKNLKNGDKIYVTDDRGKEYTFSVTDNHNYPWNNFPLQEVFGSATVARLNLITCEGTWNSASHNYSHRTVVYSELVQ